MWIARNYILYTIGESENVKEQVNCKDRNYKVKRRNYSLNSYTYKLLAKLILKVEWHTKRNTIGTTNTKLGTHILYM